MLNKYKDILIILCFILLFLFINSIVGDGILCIFKKNIGIPCPACGMTRSYFSLLSGDIKKAFFYHPLFLLPIFICVLFLLRNNAYLSKLWKSNILWVIIFIIIISVYIIRMLLLFPNIPPLDYVQPKNEFKILFHK